ncbi:unnamed protein product, partial [Amoebophrya sp. A25]|eukprot:GSA25T00020004001.1
MSESLYLRLRSARSKKRGGLKLFASPTKIMKMMIFLRYRFRTLILLGVYFLSSAKQHQVLGTPASSVKRSMHDTQSQHDEVGQLQDIKKQRPYWWSQFGPIPLRRLAYGHIRENEKPWTRRQMLDGLSFEDLHHMREAERKDLVKRRILTSTSTALMTQDPEDPEEDKRQEPGGGREDLERESIIAAASSEQQPVEEDPFALYTQDHEHCRNRFATYNAEKTMADEKGNEWKQTVSEFNIISCGDPRLDEPPADVGVEKPALSAVLAEHPSLPLSEVVANT